MFIVLFSKLNLPQTRGGEGTSIEGCGDSMGVVAVSSREDTVSKKMSWFYGCNNLFIPSSKMFPWIQLQGLPLCMYEWGRALHSILSFALWALMEFCNNIHLLQKEPTLMKGEGYTYLWVFQFLFCCCVILTCKNVHGTFY